jgi:hypothetical protein
MWIKDWKQFQVNKNPEVQATDQLAADIGFTGGKSTLRSKVAAAKKVQVIIF